MPSNGRAFQFVNGVALAIVLVVQSVNSAAAAPSCADLKNQLAAAQARANSLNSQIAEIQRAISIAKKSVDPLGIGTASLAMSFCKKIVPYCDQEGQKRAELAQANLQIATINNQITQMRDLKIEADKVRATANDLKATTRDQYINGLMTFMQEQMKNNQGLQQLLAMSSGPNQDAMLRSIAGQGWDLMVSNPPGCP